MVDPLQHLRSRIAERRLMEDAALEQIEKTPQLLKAFELLAPYMLNGDTAPDVTKLVDSDNLNKANAPRRPAGPPPPGSNRDKAIRAFRSLGSATIEEIMEESGLEKKQVRGVVNSPDMKACFPREIDEETGLGTYWYEENPDGD